jgi:hypothetical protein
MAKSRRSGDTAWFPLSRLRTKSAAKLASFFVIKV